MFTHTTKGLLLTLVGGTLLLGACKSDDDVTDTTKDYATEKQAIKETYAEIVYANYEDSYNDAVALKTSIDAFVSDPTETGFTNAKEAWLLSRESYGQTEAFRFANGPIDDEINGPEGLLNAWPLNEAYIDYVEGGSTTSIIYDTATYPTISASVLEDLNESGGETNISIGYHAIEFLLWGQDLTAPSANTPGQRLFTDYTTADHAARRSEYLAVTIDLLIGHLQLMTEEWKPDASNYRSTFEEMNSDDALEDILTSIAILSNSELAGERIYTAYDNQDQEDEHSCFSDNTHRDIILNAQGIQNVYLGTYIRTDGSIISGTSIHDLVTTVNSTIATSTNTQLTDALQQCKAIEDPFDNAITDATYRPQVLTAVTSLRTLGKDNFAEVANALDLSFAAE